MDSFKKYINLTEIKGVAGDDRLLAHGINTVLEEDVAEIIDRTRFRNKRVLEIGPKYGYHSKWIDRNLEPKELVLLELPQKDVYVQPWLSELKCPVKVVYESLLSAKSIIDGEPFDLIFCTGVLYHAVEHFKILNILRRCLADDGILLLQTSIDIRHSDPVILLNWKEPNQKGSYAYPTKSALFAMLAMTGWANVKHYVDYRPESNTLLLSCEKSDKLIHAYDGLPFGGSSL